MLQTIQRLGRWLRDALYKSYLRFFKPDGLLSLGGWPGAAQKRFERAFWHERFMVEVPEELIYWVYPFLKDIEEDLKVLGSKAKNSMKSIKEVLQYLAVVLVQDALELTSMEQEGSRFIFNDHPVHKLLMEHQLFRCESRRLAGELCLSLLGFRILL